MRKLLATILFLLPLTVFSQLKYYFSTATGNDANTAAQAQNPATPWKTITKLNSFWSSLNAGDSVLFHRGETFPLPAAGVAATKSGTVAASTNVGAYGTGARPVFDGYYTIPSWTSIGGGLYTATIPAALATMGTVTLDGVFQPMGRMPKQSVGYYNITTSGGAGNFVTSTTTTGNNPNTFVGAPSCVGGQIVWRAFHFSIWVGTINSQTATQVNYTPLPSTSGGATENPQVNYGFFLQNHPNTCTTLGEWAYNGTTHVFTMFFGGGGPGTHVVKVSAVQNAVNVAGFANISFSNIEIRGGNTDLVVLNNNSNNIKLTNCTLFGAGRYGIFANGTSSGLSVANCRIDRCNSIAIFFSLNHTGANLLADTITNTAAISGMGGIGEGQYMGIENIGSGSTIKNCYVKNTGYMGIVYRGTAQVIQNLVDSFCIVKDDGGGIYNGGQSVSGSLVSGNIILHGFGLPQGTPDPQFRAEGLYADDGASNVTYTNNSVAIMGDACHFNHASFNVTLTGNTFYDSKDAIVRYFNDLAPGTSNVTQTNNIFFSKANNTWSFRSSGGTASATTYFGGAPNVNNNFFCRPILETTLFNPGVGAGAGTYTLAGWKTFTGKEQASLGSPKTITDTSQLLFKYNASNSPATFTLPGNYIDVRNVAYNGSITLQPWTSAVLIFSSAGTPPLSATASSTTINCFGGTSTVTITATGGVPPYQYRVGAGTFASSNVFAGLAAGTYTFQIRDAALTVFSLSVTINQPTQITISQTSGTITINGGTTTTTVTASGGTGALQYSLDGGTFQTSNVFTGVAAGTHTITVRDANLCTNTLTYTLTQPGPLSASAAASPNPVTCFGGTATITVTASGGTTPYHYSLDGGQNQSQNTFLNVAAGTHTIVTGDNAGATITSTVTITQPTQITISESHTAITINGGTSTVTITASGGTGTKNYSLDGGSFQASNVFSGVLAGNHTITVRDANLCTNTLTFTITQPTALNVTAAATTNPLTCFGNTTTITVTATGGTTPYQYSINGGTFQSANTFANLGAGTYTLTVRDAASVTQTTTVTITQPTQISISESHTAIVVNGGTSTLTITASGGTGTLNYSINGTTFQASNVFNNVSAGTYTVTVRDANSCTNTLTVTITQPSALVVSAAVTTPIACNGGSGVITVTASGGTSPYTYRQGTTGSFGSSNTFTVTAGTYQYFVQDAGGALVSTTITISQPTLITVSVAVSGNAPATVTVTASGGVGTINYQLDGGSFQASNVFTNVSSGNHTVTVRDANNCTQSKIFNVGTPLQILIGFTSITCNGGQSTVTVNGTGGTSPYTGEGQFARTAGTWTFTITDQTGAQADTTIVITQPSPINISSISFAPIVVNGGTTTVTVTASGGTGTLNYKLDNGSFQASNSFSGVAAGNHTMTVRDANGCLQTQSFSISQPGSLGISLVVGTAIACNGGTTTVTVTGSGGTTPYTYGKNGTFQAAQLFSGVTAGTYTFSVKDAFNNQKDTIITISQPTALSLTVSHGTIVVNGGTTTVTASGSGGTGGLQYSLDGGAYQGSGSFAGVAAGTHTVTLKDANNCTTVNTFSITQPAALVIGISVGGSLACYGDVTTVTVSGSNGTPPYTYGKNGTFQSGTTFSSVGAGTYTFSVRDAFSQADTIITITQPSQITINVSTGTISVNGGTTTVTATASGGTGSLQYKLDAGSYQGTGNFSGVSAGTHTVTVKDANNCTNVNTFSISQPGILYVTATPTLSTVVCYGDVTTVTVSGSGGTTPYTFGKNGVFQGSGTFNNIGAGTYTFSVKDAFSAQHDTVLTISQPSLISLLQVIQYPNPIAVYGGNADSVIVKNAGGTPISGTFYQYSLDGGGFTTSDSAFQYKFTTVSGGQHTVTIKDANGCSQTYSFFINQPPAPLPEIIIRHPKRHHYEQLK